jgi:hypothetical protein
MRIVIEIDGVEVTPRVEQQSSVPETAIAPASTAVQAAVKPPDYLLRAAAALGAESAGPAPAALTEPAAASTPITSVRPATAAAHVGALDAGAAPHALFGTSLENKEKP